MWKIANMRYCKGKTIIERLKTTREQGNPLTVYPALKRIMSLAAEYNLTAYDAVYLDLSLHTGFPIATLDSDLKNAALKAGLAAV
jgi:predicted nucleic acid-binding protein